MQVLLILVIIVELVHTKSTTPYYLKQLTTYSCTNDTCAALGQTCSNYGYPSCS